MLLLLEWHRGFFCEVGSVLLRGGLISGALLLSVACAPEPIQPVARPQLSFGQEVYLALCNRVAAAENPDDSAGESSRGICLYGHSPSASSGSSVIALHGFREQLIAAIDALVPAPPAYHVEELEALAAATLPLYDDGSIPHATSALAHVLGEMLADEEFHLTLARLNQRQGHAAAAPRFGALSVAVSYPKITELLRNTLHALGDARRARDAFSHFSDALERELLAAPLAPAPDKEDSVFAGLLLTQRPELSDGRSRYVLLKDKRGLPIPAENSQVPNTSTLVPAPFADENADGFADIGNLGQFVDSAGRTLELPEPFGVVGADQANTPRDTHGRALTAQGTPLFATIDASETLPFVALENLREISPKAPTLAWDLLTAAPHLMGGKNFNVEASPGEVPFVFAGYDNSKSPLADLAYATHALSGYESMPELSDLMKQLWTEQEELAARGALFVTDLAQRKSQPDLEFAELEPGHIFVEESLLWLQKVLEKPGLLESLMVAAADPKTAELGPHFADFMKYKDSITYDPLNPNGPPVGELRTPVDRNIADLKDNRSVMSRFLHLVHDTRGAPLCNKEGAVLTLAGISYPFVGSYAECELMRFDDMSVFYLESILGTARLEFNDPLVELVADLDVLLEFASGIDGFTRNPTPQAINRMIFVPPNDFLQGLMDPPLSKDGFSIPERHPGTIFAWERAGFFEAMTPLTQAFADHDSLALFAELMSLLHRHWPTIQSETTQNSSNLVTAFAQQSGLSRFELLFHDALAGDLAPGESAEKVLTLMSDISRAIVDMPTLDGPGLTESFAATFVVPSSSETLRTRDGDQSIVWNDASTEQRQLSPIWLHYDALRRLGESLDAKIEDREKLERAADILSDHFLAVEQGPSSLQFKNRKSYAAAGLVMEYTHDTLTEYQRRGELQSLLDSSHSDIQEMLAAPTTHTALRLASTLAADVSFKTSASDAMDYYFADLPPQYFDSSLGAAVGYIQQTPLDRTTDSLNRTLALLLDDHGEGPNLSAASVEIFAAVLGSSVDTSSGSESTRDLFVTGLLQGLFDPSPLMAQPLGPTGPLGVFADAFVAVNRVTTMSNDSLGPEDFVEFIGAIHGFAIDEESGLPRLESLLLARKNP